MQRVKSSSAVYSYEKFLSLNPKLVKSNVGSKSDQCVYICPFCLMTTGKKKAKFYMCTTQGVGHCWACGVAVFRKRSIEEICADFVAHEERQKEIQVCQQWDVSRWTEPVLPDSGEPYRYLKSRHIDDRLIEKYNLRHCVQPYPGVVLPNGADPACVTFFQVRNLDKTAKLRYLNPSSLKPVYNDFFPESREAVLCEGPFSTIATDSDHYNSYGLYGKSASDFQLKWLLGTKTELFTVCLDGKEIRAILRLCKQVLTGRDEVGIVFLPYGKDPNDVIQNFHRFYEHKVVLNKLGLGIIDKTFGELKEGDETERDWVNFYQAAKQYAVTTRT